MKYKFAIEIKNHAHFTVAQAVWPHLREFTFEQIQGEFLVLEDTVDRYGNGRVALYGHEAVLELIHHIENGPEITIKKVYLKRKD